mgnify:CR=1 FL=1
MMARIVRIIVLAVSLAVTGIAAAGFDGAAAQAVAADQGQPMILPVHPEPLVAETVMGERRFTVEIADDEGERSAGLMFRTEMNDDHGMLFVFETTRRVAFWMKNTPMPLDLLFIGEDGRVVAILQGEPFSTAPIAPNGDVRFVLELKAGTAQNAGISVGDRLHHPEIDGIADAG